MDVNAFLIGFQKGKASAPSGGPKPNIACGYETPEDTSKLWLKVDAARNFEKISSKSKIPSEFQPSYTTLSTSFPSNIGGIGGALVGSKLYMFGGGSDYTGGKAIYTYDFETQTLTTLSTTLEYVTYDLRCHAAGTKIYLFCGAQDRSYSNRKICYDTETDTLTNIEGPALYMGTATALVGSKIYFFGGRAGTSSTVTTDTIRYFDTETETFTTCAAKLPLKIACMGAGAVGTKVYLFGGEASGEQYRDEILCYDTETDAIENLSAKIADGGGLFYRTVTVGEKIYLFGGVIGDGSYANSRVQVFDAVTQTCNPVAVSIASSLFSLCVLWEGRIYVFGGCAQMYYYGIKSATKNIRRVNLAEPMPMDDNEVIVIAGNTGLYATILRDEDTEIVVGLSGAYISDGNGIGQFMYAYVFDKSSNSWKTYN